MKASATARVALATAIIAAPLSGCGLADLISGKESCRTWTANRQAHSFEHGLEVALARRFFRDFYAALETSEDLKARGVNLRRDDDRLLAHLDAYCAAHPQATAREAARDATFDATGVSGVLE
jgi:hypothetical protein